MVPNAVQSSGSPALPLVSPAHGDDRRRPSLTLNTRRDPRAGSAVVTVGGEIDAWTAPRLAEILTARARSTIRSLIIDLSGVTFLGAAGLEVLARACLLGRSRGIRVRLITGKSRAAARALAIAGLHDRLPVISTVDVAHAVPQQRR